MEAKFFTSTSILNWGGGASVSAISRTKHWLLCLDSDTLAKPDFHSRLGCWLCSSLDAALQGEAMEEEANFRDIFLRAT